MTSEATINQPRLVWYRLVDSETGQPYKATTASSVFLPTDLVIDQFRDAVQAKWDKPRYLKDIPAGALIVYKNKDVFDNRNADDVMEEPLEEDSLINDLGKSTKEALIVLVPSHQTLSNTSFNICTDQFFINIIVKASECNEFISFADPIPSIESLKQLYIRECYKSIASSIQTGHNIHKVILTGTPGIGKSLFLFYLLYKLVKEGKRVLFIYHPFHVYYDGNGGIFRFSRGHLPANDDKSFWNDTLWCLLDSYEMNNLKDFSYDQCIFVLSTSPRRELVNDFKKNRWPQIFYMPTWTEAELEKIVYLFPNATEWRSRFEILGGIPRLVLYDTRIEPCSILRRACSVCSLNDCIKAVGLDSTITDKSKIIHSLIHITSTSPFTQSSVCYASKSALDMIVQEKGSEAKNKMLDILNSYKRNPLTGALCGYIFESYTIDLLEKGGAFHCRLLAHKNAEKETETTLTIAPSVKIVADKVSDQQSHYQLYVPKSKNYPAIDAWIPGIGAFHITVAETHKLNESVKNDLALLGSGKNKLYWLLPPQCYESFTSKQLKNIDQYAVLIRVTNMTQF